MTFARAQDRDLSAHDAPLYRIGFLYNHEAAHQVAHSAPVAAELARQLRVEVTVLATSEPLLERARQCFPPELVRRAAFELLAAPAWQRGIGRVADAAAPFSRIANLI